MSLILPTPNTAPVDPAEVPQLVRHTKRPSWGRGALIWTRPTKRAYQFEDGRLRVFKRGFFDLLEPVDVSTVEADSLTDRLQERGEARKAVREARKDARKEAPPVDAQSNLEAQIGWFKEQWPEGFRGDGWKERHRGGEGRRLKRHRDPLLEDVQELLSKDALAKRIEAGEATEVHQELLAILDKSDVVPPGQRRHLSKAKVDAEWLQALYDLLHGDAADDVRFERWVVKLRAASDDACTWPIATMPLALSRPEGHPLIRRTVMRRQLKRIRPGLVVPTEPGAPTLRRLEKAIDWMKEIMAEQDLVPQDHLDIYDFMRLTLQKKALEAIGDK